MDPSVLARKQLTELKAIASSLEMRGYQRLKKADLIDAIVRTASSNDGGQGGESQRASANGSGPSQPSLDDADDDATRTRTRVRTRSRTREGDDDAPESGGDEQGRSSEGAGTNGDGGADRGEPRSRSRARERGDADEDARSDGGGRDQDASARSASRDDASSSQESGGKSGGGGRDRGDGDVKQRDGDGQKGRGDGQRGDGDGQRGDGDGQRGDGQKGRDGGGQQRNQGGSDDDDRGGRRSRRSRRERRRKKDQQGGGGGQHDDGGAEPGEVRTGVLDILPEGYGFLRTSGYLPGDKDVYISQSHVRKHGLRSGDIVEGPIQDKRSNQKVPGLHHVQKVNGVKPDQNGNLPHRPEFKDMTPLFPEERLHLETPEGPISMRIVDLMSPVGKGQRALVVSPPKAGKTTILKELGQAIAFNNPECHLMVVLVDERPEEVTDMQRSVPGEIIASTFDRPADDHTTIAELAMERAKRLVEMGKDVVVLLDSITRLARAYNLAAPASGRIMSGGVDSSALYPPKRFFGAARNIEHGGSLTIIASALIETGSKMDEVIFEEFKGTGNSELRLSRELEQKRVFPAIDIGASSTRKEELLFDREELTIVWKLRRVLSALDSAGAAELLIDKMRQTRSNNQFLVQIQKSNLST